MPDITPAIGALDIPARRRGSFYPAPFAARVEGRVKRPLGDWFGLKNFGVNLTTIPPGGTSSLHHNHSKQDEFIYILSGTLTLCTDAGETLIGPGMVMGFPAGGSAHHLENRGKYEATYLEIGDRSPGDKPIYPQDDLQLVQDETGAITGLQHKDGTPY